MSPAPARGDFNHRPHRTGPRDLGSAAAAASLTGMLAVMALLAAAAGDPDPIAAVAALPVPAA